MAKILFSLSLLAFLSGCSTRSFDTSGPITEHRFIPQEDFLRISEYFTGREPLTDRVYIRTMPEDRGGYYWILPVRSKMVAQQPLLIALSVQVPGDPAIRKFNLRPDRQLTKKQTLWIGLTGSDWPDPDLPPVAWQLSILSEDGTAIETRESFLWTSHPEEVGENVDATQ